MGKRSPSTAARGLLASGLLAAGSVLAASEASWRFDEVVIGREVGIDRQLADGAEATISLEALLAHGERLFTANWTSQDGAGRPFTKGTNAPLADTSAPLVFPRAFNRISGPDANGCAGCHNAPFGIAGGGGDFVTGVFVLAQRFDFVTFDRFDLHPGRGSVDERGDAVTLQTVGNYRSTPGLFGSGYIEMLARQMTADLQRIRDAIPPGGSGNLVTKGVSFGVLARHPDGNWDVTGVDGLPTPSLRSSGAEDPPSLLIRPFHQAGAVVSLRQFTNNAYTHHLGIRTDERQGIASTPAAPGQLTRADVTAVTLFQATLPVPGRVIARHPQIEEAVRDGERLFTVIGCGGCHLPALPLETEGWVFVEPNPFNPPGNLQPGEGRDYAVNLNDGRLPGPRLAARGGVVLVPAFTDFKLHDITSGPDDPNVEPLDMNAHPGSAEFFAGNARFITRRLWGAGNSPPYFHHGQFTTLREAVLAHHGAALASREAFEVLGDYERDAVIEFLKSLRILQPGTTAPVVDEYGRPRRWGN